MEKDKRILGWPILLGLMFFAFVLLALRRPDIITHAQPWAEDGALWMSSIYNDGFWQSLLKPEAGYYQTISRLTYGIALLFGLKQAALVANIIAILIRCFLVGFIISNRMNFIQLRYRLLIAAYLILMPNVAEGFVNITNVHWYLSMYLLAVVMANDAESLTAKVHDFTVLVISGLSGPFVIFIAPCLIIKRLYTHGSVVNAIKKISLFDVVMAACCLIQIVEILTSPTAERSHAPLGASFPMLANLVSCRIIYGSFLPFEMARKMAAHGNINNLLFIALSIILIFSFIKYGWRVKSIILFPVLMIGFALAKPLISVDQPQWPVAFNSEAGERYFYVTNVALACLATALVSILPRMRTQILVVGLIIFAAFIPKGFRLNELPDSGYYEDVSAFDAKESGETVSIRILPPCWAMKLVKK
ncbi:glucosyl transferase [Pantoea sp. AS-PWVM4]|uniref:glucosyl transferase n=1 Tax=Pantoea sp. AS-PWVM4 TaxID=1332069 RepID=UPI0009DB8B12|nr:glucosyl transferase [Pantoea sp. AS-PWVM4]